MRSVLARRAVSAGSLSAAMQRARGVRAERLRPQRGDPLGVGVAQRGLGRRVARAAPRRARRASRAARRRTALTSRAPPGESRLDELDGLADGGVGGDAVEEGELVEAEPQGGEHERLEPRERAARRAPRSGGRASPGAGRRRRRAAWRARGRAARAASRAPRRAARDPPTRRPRTRAADPQRARARRRCAPATGIWRDSRHGIVRRSSASPYLEQTSRWGREDSS